MSNVNETKDKDVSEEQKASIDKDREDSEVEMPAQVEESSPHSKKDQSAVDPPEATQVDVALKEHESGQQEQDEQSGAADCGRAKFEKDADFKKSVAMAQEIAARLDKKRVRDGEEPESKRTNDGKIRSAIQLPIDEHPNVNFIGAIVGREGSKTKEMESKSRCSIFVRGKGASSPGHGDSETPTYVLIIGDNDSDVDVAKELVQEVIDEKIASGPDMIPLSSSPSSLTSSQSNPGLGGGQQQPQQASGMYGGASYGSQGQMTAEQYAQYMQQYQAQTQQSGSQQPQSSYAQQMQQYYHQQSAESRLEKVYVPSNHVGYVIGRGGETISRIQEQSGAHVQVQRDSEADMSLQTREVSVQGTPAQIAAAKELITQLLHEKEVGVSSVPGRIVGAQGPVPGPSVGGVGGGYGQQSRGGMRPGGAPGYGGGSPMGGGYGGGMMSGPSRTIYVPNRSVGMVIGSRGATINELQQRSGARIQVGKDHETTPENERPLTLVGSESSIVMAERLVMEKVASDREGPGPQWQSQSALRKGVQQGYGPTGAYDSQSVAAQQPGGAVPGAGSQPQQGAMAGAAGQQAQWTPEMYQKYYQYYQWAAYQQQQQQQHAQQQQAQQQPATSATLPSPSSAATTTKPLQTQAQATVQTQEAEAEKKDENES